LTIRRSELPLALLMSAYFLVIMMIFWILKPLKKSLFIGRYDEAGFDFLSSQFSAAQAELLAKGLNILAALMAVAVFTWLARRFHRQNLTFIFTGLFLAGFAIYALTLGAPEASVIWSFYLFGDLFSVLMVATFFTFLNDSVSPSAAKRMYGPVVLGGVVGGALGSVSLYNRIDSMQPQSWLWVCVGLGLLVLAIAYAAGRIVDAHPEFALDDHASEETRESRQTPPHNPLVESARLVFKSKYLVCIASIVFLYEIVSTCMDFQFTSTLSHYLDGPALGNQFSLVYAITNIAAVCVQLFLTSMIMTRTGVGLALLVTPILALTGSTAFMLFPMLWVGSLLNTLDNGFNYSINQSAREALYVPLGKNEKYKGKAFIDMFIKQFAKGIAILVTLVITWQFEEFLDLRWLSLFSICVIAVWIVAAKSAGKRFHPLASARDAEHAASRARTL
jgi:AAA family ATP:ADP antiporter